MYQTTIIYCSDLCKSITTNEPWHVLVGLGFPPLLKLLGPATFTRHVNDEIKQEKRERHTTLNRLSAGHSICLNILNALLESYI
jgi:hypothetical protein